MRPHRSFIRLTGTSRRSGRVRLAGIAVLALGAAGLSGCSALHKAETAVHDIEGNKATIDAFTKNMSANTPQHFQVTYVTTGSSPATVVYAAEPPEEVAFDVSPSSSSGSGSGTAPLRLLLNSSGGYACSQASASGGAASKSWSCDKLSKVSAGTERDVVDFYTPSHWVSFLQGVALAAGFAGDKVSSSTKTVNGFAMKCVDLVASGVKGTSTICTTAQDLLGYVKVASDSTSFEITHYSSSPAASLFRLPAGAKVTTVTLPTTTSTTS